MPPTHRRKPSPKQDAITRHLREQIVAGTLAPGARLPTRAALEQRFGVSSVTVQRALDALADHGFITARGTLGTFVNARPPHANEHALVFFARPHGDGWIRFRAALLAASSVLATRTGLRLTPFFCPPDAAGEREHLRLQQALAAQALAGVVFTSHPYPLERSPVLTAPGVARVALMGGDDFPGLPRVLYDEGDFLSQAMTRFASCQRRRVALLTVPFQFSTAQIDAQAARHGLTAPAHWRQTVHPHHAPSARACAHLLFHDGQRQRPDALLISDDNLLEHALAGLDDAGVRIGADVEVIAHANFPTPEPAPAGLRRLGYDARTTLATCLELINAQRLGRATQHETLVAPVFADDSASAS